MKADPAHDPPTPPPPGPAPGTGTAGDPRALDPTGPGPRGGVLILNWRDTTHPEGGGSEVYVERVAAGLAAQGRPVTLFCAAHPGAPATEGVGGIRVVRRGGRLTVYLHAWWAHLTGRLGGHEVVVDVQNGMPFLSALWCRRRLVDRVPGRPPPVPARPLCRRLRGDPAGADRPGCAAGRGHRGPQRDGRPRAGRGGAEDAVPVAVRARAACAPQAGRAGPGGGRPHPPAPAGIAGTGGRPG